MAIGNISELSRLQIHFDNSYARLPGRFYARVPPTPAGRPRLVRLNTALAGFLGLDSDALSSSEGMEILSGNRIAEGSEPLAMAYAGHQFGNFVPRLGDGRANLIGEVLASDGVRYDLHLKGAGPTPFSRNGDGRATLSAVLREYLVSESMAALGVPTTRALAAVATGQRVVRETLQPGAVLTRVARSHLRVGTFQYFAAQGDIAGVHVLADYAIERHYPEAGTAPRKYRALLDGVIERQAKLVAQWLMLGFVHGVMNTDNTSISGETIDYGPCAFLEVYDPDTVFSSIDQQGRYAYANQPAAMHWNLARLAEALLPLLNEEAGSEDAGMASAHEAIDGFRKHFEAARSAGLRKKLGLTTADADDTRLADDLLRRMAENSADYTLTFRRLCDAAAAPDADRAVSALFAKPESFDTWATEWRERLAKESLSPAQRSAEMRLANPLFIPRNHLVEAALKAASENENLQPFEELLDVLAHPYQDQPGMERYSFPALPEETVTATFCGT